MVKKFFAGNEIKTLKWPARSPCINNTKDVWRMISDLVYGGPQYQDIKLLEKSITQVNKFFSSQMTWYDFCSKLCAYFRSVFTFSLSRPDFVTMTI